MGNKINTQNNQNKKEYNLSNNSNPPLQRGFTLVELLVVIAIIAVLSTAVILALNPAELLKQGRDSTRMSDIKNLQTSINLYLMDSTYLGEPGITYISVPDTSTSCSNLSIPSGSYRCVSSTNYRKIDGNGWIPINLNLTSLKAPLSILPIDPINDPNKSYYTYSTDGTGYVITAAPESKKYSSPDQSSSFVATLSSSRLIGGNFPLGWIYVPGNSDFNTPGFWVMKYEAKCVEGTTPLTLPDTYHIYNNVSTPCTSNNNRYIASTPNGYPITNISHTDAKTYCQSIGAHLITNDEYMTIARNIEQNPINWSGNKVNDGYIYSGHNDNSPGNALEASSNDNDGYFGTNNTPPSNQKRTLTLSNNQVIWDIPGNVWEHTQRSTNNAGDNTNIITTPSCSSGSGWQWCQYGNSLPPYIIAWNDSSFSQATVGPSNSNWNSTQGIGQVYTNSGASGGSVFLRGGHWDDGANAGVFTLYLTWGTSTQSYNVGLRCVR